MKTVRRWFGKKVKTDCGAVSLTQEGVEEDLVFGGKEGTYAVLGISGAL